MTAADHEHDTIVLSVRRTRRDLRLSALVLGVGAGLYVLGVSLPAATEAGDDGWSLVAALLVEAGWILVLVGLLFVGVNWWLLRQRAPRSRPPADVALDSTTTTDRSPTTGQGPADRPLVACANCGRVSPAGQLTEYPSCRRPLPAE